jgi:hypothetical protein
MGAGNYGGQGGGMPAYQQMSSYPQGPSGKGGSSSYGPPPQRMAPPSPFGSGKGGGRAGMQDSYSRMMPPPFMQAQQGQMAQGPLEQPETVQAPEDPFAGNAEYQAMMDYQKSLGPTEEQQTRLKELQSAFEGSGAFKDYRIQQLERQQQEAERMAQMMQRRNPYGMGGIGGFRGQYGPKVQREFGGFAPFQQQYMPQPMYNPMYEQMYKKGGKVS